MSVRGSPGVYNVMYAYGEELPGFYAGRLALQLVDSLLPPELQGVEALDVLFDKRDATCSSGYCYLDEGRNVIGSLRYRF